MIKVRIVHVCDKCGDETAENVHLTEVTVKKNVAEFQCNPDFICFECIGKKIDELEKSGKATDFMTLI